MHTYGLQLIIGTDKRNPVFTVHKKEDTNEIYVFYGGALLEVISNKKDNPELKLMLARLYKANVKVKALIENFGYSYPTIRRWAEALKSGDAERLRDALSGQGAPKKLTKEIEVFARVRFLDIYAHNKRSYSSKIRQEIQEIFKKTISRETLRPLFKELKQWWPDKLTRTIPAQLRAAGTSEEVISSLHLESSTKKNPQPLL